MPAVGKCGAGSRDGPSFSPQAPPAANISASALQCRWTRRVFRPTKNRASWCVAKLRPRAAWKRPEWSPSPQGFDFSSGDRVEHLDRLEALAVCDPAGRSRAAKRDRSRGAKHVGGKLVGEPRTSRPPIRVAGRVSEERGQVQRRPDAWTVERWKLMMALTLSVPCGRTDAACEKHVTVRGMVRKEIKKRITSAREACSSGRSGQYRA